MDLIISTFLIVCKDDSRATTKAKDNNQVNIPTKDSTLDESNIITHPDNNDHFNETNPSQLKGSNCKRKCSFWLI